MNPEYDKLNKSKAEFTPTVDNPTYFISVPDVLIPTEHAELEGHPLAKEDEELIRETVTPPPTPPELSPGLAGCSLFRPVKTFYMDPIFKDEEYVKKFMGKVGLWDCANLIASFVMLSCVCLWEELDIYLLRHEYWIFYMSGFGVGGMVLYLNVVGLCRNSPIVEIAYAMRGLITTLTFGFGCLIIHILFVQYVLDDDELKKYLETDESKEGDPYIHSASEFHREFSSPYLGPLIIALYWGYMGVLAVLFLKLGYVVSDYRVPIIIHSISYIISPFMVTLMLSNVLSSKSLGYDLFQVIFGCLFANLFALRTPNMMTKLIGGKLCPLNEGELMYAVVHYGIY